MISVIYGKRVLARSIIAAAAIGVLATPGQAQSTGKIKKMEDRLAAAGFEAKPATTPEL